MSVLIINSWNLLNIFLCHEIRSISYHQMQTFLIIKYYTIFSLQDVYGGLLPPWSKPLAHIFFFLVTFQCQGDVILICILNTPCSPIFRKCLWEIDITSLGFFRCHHWNHWTGLSLWDYFFFKSWIEWLTSLLRLLICESVFIVCF